MKQKPFTYALIIALLLNTVFAAWASLATKSRKLKRATPLPEMRVMPEDTTKSKEPTKLRYKTPPPSYDPSVPDEKGMLQLKEPANIKTEVEFDPRTKDFNYSKKIGSQDYRSPSYMSFEEYLEYDMQKMLKKNWDSHKEAEKIKNTSKPLVPKIEVKGEAFDRIFGGNTVDIRPQGTAQLIFGVNTAKTANPALTVRQQKQTNFNFDQNIQLNVVGKIGEKLKLSTSYNTKATFDFENQMKMEYTGFEDEIIKKIEAGNVSLPLTGSLITGSQSLFGIKTQLQFGKLFVTTVLSQQRGKKSVQELSGGAQTTKFEVNADNYEANKHFFLSQYFRDAYDEALAQLPLVRSQILITKVEVWVTNTSGAVESRNVVALTDLGESKRDNSPNPDQNKIWFNKQFVGDPDTTATIYPDNRQSNNLYTRIKTLPGLSERPITTVKNVLAPYQNSQGFLPAQDYEVLERARKLTASDFTFNTRLGFISLNQALNNGEILAVAFQYTIGTKTYQVGEFSTDGIADPKYLLVKLLKPTNVRVKLPVWDLMMKNVYNINGYNIAEKDFQLNVFHRSFEKGVDVNYMTEGNALKGKIWNQIMNIDKLNNLQEPYPDGYFDFVAGVTIDKDKGRIYFPVVEPFGRNLRAKMATEEPAITDKYVFQELYDSTKIIAQQIPLKNRYKLKGSYSSSSGSEISLNSTNIPKGSVVVSAGGVPLKEDVDYTVDYLSGKVKIINSGILESGKPIQISSESNALFNQTKRFVGTHLDYKASKDFTLGATIINLTERPLTQKVNFGNEPISNTIWGFDGNYTKETPFVTKLVDHLPVISTKEKSSVNVSGEFAQLIPGHSKAIGKSGTSYIDDFEGSQRNIDIKAPSAWILASIPQKQPELFPEAELYDNSLKSGLNRAKLAWYVVDPLFTQNNVSTPDHIKNDPAEQSNHFVRQIIEQEVFPNKQPANNIMNNIAVLDLAYYPDERGPYNYDTDANAFSAGLLPNGRLNNPQSRWAGIMRRVETTDFESANVEFIQFWVMDPFNEDNKNPSSTGDLYFNIGDVSEDVLQDNRRSFENGLPTTATPVETSIDTTQWGVIPTTQSIVNAFDPQNEARQYQDVGLDGMRDEDEVAFFENSFLRRARSIVTEQGALDTILDDPSADNYKHFRSNAADSRQEKILTRYKNISGYDGNSSVEQPDGYPATATNLPNVEDVNKNNNLETTENYFQYKVSLNPNNMNVGENYITDVITAKATTKAGTRYVKWYQFKIPVRSPEKVVGEIQDFRSIRFMRMFLKGFDKPIICRFARLELISSDWRKYVGSLKANGERLQEDNFSNTAFDIATVNVEENGERTPINYVLPPGIERQQDYTTQNLRQVNEQSLSYNICGLEDGDGRAAYKNLEYDIRFYKRLKLHIHAEQGVDGLALNEGDLTAFMRIGTDFDQNYYEYEIPLKITSAGATLREDVWPTTNEMNILLEDLTNTKLERNTEIAKGTPGVRLSEVYPLAFAPGKPHITVVGNPNLAAVKTVMIGVRNPKRQGSAGEDDGMSKCAILWVNELRLTDFDEKGGWASNMRVSQKLADLGSVTLSGSRLTQGFGTIEQKINERRRENTILYDASTNIELGKFIPKKIGIKIPAYYSYSENFTNPMYHPLNPDILYADEKKAIKPVNPEAWDSIRMITQDYTRRKSYNFTNVRKEKTGSSTKSHFYDISNLNFTYSYSDVYKRNINTEYNSTKTYRAGMGYNFNATPKNYKPLGKVKFLKGNALKLITDFNFTLFPSRISFTTDWDRNYSEQKNRNITGDDVLIIPTYFKQFTTTRTYGYKHDLAKSINLNYTANNLGRIDEPGGKAYRSYSKVEPFEAAIRDSLRDSLMTNIKNGGRTTNFQHNANLDWAVPINKIPLLNWVNIKTKYGATYDWAAPTPSLRDSVGNVIKNSNQKSINGTFSLTQLYNKVPYLKRVNTNAPKPPPIKIPKGASKAVRDSINKINKQKQIPPLEHALRALMSMKSVSLTYTENRGTILPGYKPLSMIMGMSDGSNGYDLAPGPRFVFGDQDTNIVQEAINNGWLVKSNLPTTKHENTYTQSINGKTSLEPFKDFKVDLTATRSSSKNRSDMIRYDPLTDGFYRNTMLETGNYSVSIISIRTAFVKDDKVDHSNATFLDFVQNRRHFTADKLAADRAAVLSDYAGDLASDSGGVDYRDGYKGTSQDVMIPAFIQAYTKAKQSKIKKITNFPQIPLPAWNINYQGLSKLEAVKKYFKTVSLMHGYRSTYNVGSYSTNLFYNDNDGDGYTTVRDNNGNFRSKEEINTVSISEQFSPLLGVNFEFLNGFQTKVEWKKERNITLSLNTSILTEMRSNELVTSIGYTLKNVPFPLNKRLKTNIKSDLKLQSSLNIRLNNTIIRKVVENVNQATAGQTVITIRNTADYALTDKLSIQLFYDKIITIPLVPTTFRTSNSNGGLSIRFTLS